MGRREAIMAAAFAAGVAATCGWWSASAQEQPRAGPGCGGETLAQGVAGRVLDGRTFALEDGREIRLAGIEVPPLPEPQEKSAAPGGTAVRDALAGLLSGAQITLKQADVQRTDRYGRSVAYAFARRDGVDHAVQADLAATGHARVAARVGSRACAMELLRR